MSRVWTQRDPCIWSSQVIFAVVLIMEVCLRVHLSGLKSYFCGSDKFWNFFEPWCLAELVLEFLLVWCIWLEFEFAVRPQFF